MSLSLSNYKRISGLIETTTLADNDVFAIDNSNDSASKKVTYTSLKTLLKNYFKLGSLTSGYYIQGNSYASDLGLLDTQAHTQVGLIGSVLADIAPVEASTTASQAYQAGSYLIYNNQLYMVTVDIASGGTITVGTNVTSVSAMSALISAVLSLADAYDGSSSYVAGDIVTHNGYLYICTGQTTGNWNSSKWSSTTVADLVDSLSDDIGDIGNLNTTANTNLVAAINEVDSHADTNATAISSLTANMSDAYSSSSTYAVGDYCIHDNTLYRCTTAITTAEAWTAGHWTATTIADELEKIGFHDLIVVTLPGITSLPKTFNVTGITSDHELVQEGFGYVSPASSLGSDWNINTGSGTVQVTGTMSGSTSTTIKVTMGIPNKKITGVAQ